LVNKDNWTFDFLRKYGKAGRQLLRKGFLSDEDATPKLNLIPTSIHVSSCGMPLRSITFGNSSTYDEPLVAIASNAGSVSVIKPTLKHFENKKLPFAPTPIPTTYRWKDLHAGCSVYSVDWVSEEEPVSMSHLSKVYEENNSKVEDAHETEDDEDLSSSLPKQQRSLLASCSNDGTVRVVAWEYEWKDGKCRGGASPTEPAVLRFPTGFRVRDTCWLRASTLENCFLVAGGGDTRSSSRSNAFSLRVFDAECGGFLTPLRFRISERENIKTEDSPPSHVDDEGKQEKSDVAEEDGKSISHKNHLLHNNLEEDEYEPTSPTIHVSHDENASQKTPDFSHWKAAATTVRVANAFSSTVRASSKPTTPFLLWHGHKATVAAVKEWSNKSSSISAMSVAADSTLRLWDLRMETAASTFYYPSTYEANAPLLMASTLNDLVSLTSVAAYQDINDPTSKNPRYIAVGDVNGSIAVTDIVAGRILSSVNNLHPGGVRSLETMGPLLLSTGMDGTIHISSRKSDGSMEISASAAHSERSLCARWHPNVPAVVSSAGDGTVMLWSLEHLPTF
jgi:WD40 repeat protein